RETLANDVFRGSTAALAIKSLASVAGFAMFALASRLLDTYSFGHVAVLYNAISFLAVLSLCGQETLIVRSWNEYHHSDRPALAYDALRFGARIVLASTLAVSLIGALLWRVFDQETSTGLIAAAALFLFLQACMNFSAQFSRVAGGLIVAEFPRELLWRT